MARSSSRRYLPAALAFLALLALIVAALTPRAGAAAHPNPVAAAWEQARASGAYHFSGTVAQVTLPSARIDNVGRTSRTEQLQLEGQTSLRDRRIELQLWSDSGSVLEGASGVAVKVEDGKTWTRQGGGEWQEASGLTDAVAPQGDFMAYLAAVRDVGAGTPDTRAGVAFTRYAFRIDGPTFAAYMRDQIEQAMRRRGELAATARVDLPQHYRDMTGSGELWVGGDGLPLRQVLDLQFPEQGDARVSATIALDFSRFAMPAAPAGFVGALADLAPSANTLFAVVLALALSAFFVRFHRARWLERALSLALVVCVVAGPLLSNLHTRSLLDAQAAQAAERDQQREESAALSAVQAAVQQPAFDPHRDPAARAAGDDALPLGARTAPAPVAQTDNGADADADTLTDFVEERVGTDPNAKDTDEDGITDDKEVKGFSFSGKTWYADALELDSNGDGIPDGVEWDANNDGAPDDTNANGIPDLFDNDNDGDGVPDRKDIAPFTQSSPSAPFTQSNPLKLTLRNIEAGRPTFVDFQLRPNDAKHLWFAFNPLDWPSDDDGQVRDVDASANDMKLIPMLEIRIAGAPTNLPPLSDLAPFNISVNDLTSDGSSKVAYVPLSIISDEKSGERVAFSGRMRYLPAGSWPSPHEVRLAWIAQTTTDVPCEAGEAGCGADGYIHNVAQAVQSYYDDWTLSGLSVQEDHGTKTAIVYEDPAVDNNLKDDNALWLLSHGLDNAFVGGRDQDSNGQRDVTIDEIARRFDRTANAGVSEATRWAVPNILRVQRKDYTTFDQAMASTTMTDTTGILSAAFDARWNSDKTLKPLLMFANEVSVRALGLDASATSGGYVTLSSGAAVVDMQPSGQAKVPVELTASLKWMSYCRADGAAQWDRCSADAYWDELDRRYGTAITLSGDPADADVAAGRSAMMLLYNETLRGGVSRVVQRNNQLVSSRYSLKSDSETEATARLAGIVGAAAVPAIANIVIMARYVDKITVLQYLGRLFKEVRGGTVGQLAVQALDVLRNFRQNKLVGGGIVLGAVVVVGAIGALAATLAGQFGNLTSQIAIKVLVISITTFLGVISPILTVVDWVGAVKAAGSAASVLRSGSAVLGTSAKAGVIGAVIGVVVTWGFFIYSMVSNNVSAFSPEFNKALAETIAATIYLIFIAILSATVVGLIIVGIIAFIDAVLTAVCELGVDALRTVPGLGGACFTLGTAAVKVIAYLLYNYQEMVDLARSDLLVTGAPDLTLANPSAGYVAGAPFSVSLPVTTTAVHKNPDPANGIYINLYLWLYSPDNLRSSTFRYSLTRPSTGSVSAERGQMVNEWRDVRERNADEGGRYVLTPMYRGQASQTPSVSSQLPTAGLNRPTDFFLNMGYAVPAYECIGIPNIIPPWTPPIIPVCYTRDLKGSESVKVDAIKLDIFPATLDAFAALANKPDGGRGLAWDSRFDSIPDSDGDGLLSSVHNGVDPDDTTWDTDGDGLGDALELERQQAGANFSPRLWDTDNDGLADAQELELGTNPSRADSDSDGIRDGDEVSHLVYTYNATTKRVQTNGTLAGGCAVTINASLTVRVSPDPLRADSDGDGMSDKTECDLAADPNPALRVDDQNRPYHPLVVNTPPLTVFTASSDADGFLAPGQTLAYTSTVVTRVPLAPGVLDVTVPGSFGASPAPYALPFDPATFNTSQSVTQQSNLVVAAGAGTGTAVLNSTVRTRLAGGGAGGWAWDAITTEAALGGVKSNQLVEYTAVAPKRADSSDSFQVAALSSNPSNQLPRERRLPFTQKDVLSYALPSGTSGAVDNDTDTLGVSPYLAARPDMTALRGAGSPNVACNDAGNCMIVWDEFDFCNTVTINSITVNTAGPDPGGIEPLIYLVRDGGDAQPQDGGYELLWDALNNGGNDMPSGQKRGPDANGFPITRSFCGSMRLDLYEVDGNYNYSLDPSKTQWSGMELIDEIDFQANSLFGTSNLTWQNSSNQHSITLNLTIPQKQHHYVVGAVVGPDGAVVKPKFSLGAVGSDYYRQFYRPAVASDGTSFVAAWELSEYNPVPGGISEHDYSTILSQAFNNAGAPINSGGEVSSNRRLRVSNEGLTRPFAELSIAYIGDRYRVTRLLRPVVGNAVSTTDGQPVANLGIESFDVDRNGLPLASNGNLVEDQARDDATRDAARLDANLHDLAYNPATNNTMLVYQASNGSVRARLGGASSSQTLAAAGSNPHVVYHAPSAGWLVSWQDASNTVQVLALKGDGTPLITATPQNVFAAPARSAGLAGPSAGAQPLVDGRFEELPGATTFADSSGRGASITCSGASCPSAGNPGARDTNNVAVGTPGSDYSLAFDGADDFLTINRSLPDSFTIAFWVKSASGANNNAIIVDQGANVANGYTVWMGNGVPALLIGTGQTIAGTGRIDNGQWHFVAATRDRASGRVAMYVDGAQVASTTFATGALNAVADIRVGGDRSGARDFRGGLDQLQFFPTVLGASAVNALYRSQQLSFAVATGASAAQDAVQWARLSLRQSDTRGGALSASGSLNLTVDADKPTATLVGLANNQLVKGGETLIIGGGASDQTSGVASVEVSINNGAWQRASGAESWTFALPIASGNYAIRARATDAVGNVGDPSPTITLRSDATPPTVSINATAATVVPTRNANGQWSVTLRGGANDASGSGLQAVEVRLQGSAGEVQDHGWQQAALSGASWEISYALDGALSDPTGVYTVLVRAEDKLGNRTADNAATATLRLDSAGPAATLSPLDATRQVITRTLTLTGLVSDTLAGLDRLEIAFTPIEQVGALPAGLTGEQAEAQLNRAWLPVTLAQRGAGVLSSAWSAPVPAGLEGEYQIDLRATDTVGNRRISASQWRGVIDNAAPRLVLTTTATGAIYVDTASGATHYAINYVCAAQDRNLSEVGFVCPDTTQTPDRTFLTHPVLQQLFPDRTIRNTLGISYTVWAKTTTPAATLRACDIYGNCATASQGSAPALAAANTALADTASAAAPGAPRAVVVSPASQSFVAANGTVNVAVAAEAGQSLKEVTLSLDGAVVQTLTFDQAAAITRTLRTVVVAVAAEGQHTLVARATDWAGATQSALFPARFTLDSQDPTLTLDAAPLGVGDTWQQGSGVLRFNGTVGDANGLAAVQLRVGDEAFADATINANGTWTTAYYVPDPEGKSLAVTVRAIDRSGRTTVVNSTIATSLSPADAPDTAISATPANPSDSNAASFAFSATAGGRSVAGFECSLDDGVYQPCASPHSYADLSKGGHSFRVRAIDSAGNVDLSPATYTWSVRAGQPDATITSGPASITVSRSASIVFSGGPGAQRFECALDNAAFAPCTSPKGYAGLVDGPHTVLVRALDASGKAGPADRYTWTVVNKLPVAGDIAVTTGVDTVAPITLSASDENGDALLYRVVAAPAHGVLTGTAPNLTYIPDTGYHGFDSFTYRVSDGQGESNLATVRITVNSPPVAFADSYSVNEDTLLAVSLLGVLANDTDADRNPLTAQLVRSVTHGTLTLNPNGGFSYTPALNYNGPDSFTYRASDGIATSNEVTVSITVIPVNDAPTLVALANACAASNVPTGSFRLTLADVDSPVASLTLRGTSTNAALVPVSGITFAGSDASRTVTIAAATTAGTSQVAIIVSDGQDSSQQLITVTEGNGNNQTINGAAGVDLIFGQGGDDVLNGLGGSDLLCGGSGNDTLNGGDGDDALDGHNGDDRLNGEAGNDTLTGGASADRFDGGADTDTITDFKPTEGDTRVNVP